MAGTGAEMKRQGLFLEMYAAMLEVLGPSGWWPAETPFEMAVGAILTQNTNWDNVEKAIGNLRAADVLAPRRLYELPEADLAELLRPAGYFRRKAARLRNLLALVVEELSGDIANLAGRDMEEARARLLAVRGVGPETADSILLYGLGYPSFVVDAYTARICSRHGLVPEEVEYGELRELFMDALPEDVVVYKELHALFVRVGNGWCRPRAPKCASCPLARFLP